MRNLEKLFAEKLLKIKAVKIQPANPFTWPQVGNRLSIVITARPFLILLFAIL